jgi:hypothetical protein
MVPSCLQSVPIAIMPRPMHELFIPFWQVFTGIEYSYEQMWSLDYQIRQRDYMYIYPARIDNYTMFDRFYSCITKLL